MSQGFAGYNIMDSAFTIKDGANLDAFSRLRVSNPLTLFNAQFTYDVFCYPYRWAMLHAEL
jgi:hypothetical protein